MSKDPKDWQGWALGIACALVFAFGSVVWANATSRLSATEGRLQIVEIDHATLREMVKSMKETVERIDRKIAK